MKNFLKMAVLALVLFIGNSSEIFAQGPPPPPPPLSWSDECFTMDDGFNVFKVEFEWKVENNVAIRTRKIYRSKNGSAFILLSTTSYSSNSDYEDAINVYYNDPDYTHSSGLCNI